MHQTFDKLQTPQFYASSPNECLFKPEVKRQGVNKNNIFSNYYSSSKQKAYFLLKNKRNLNKKILDSLRMYEKYSTGFGIHKWHRNGQLNQNQRFEENLKNL